jgi:hypothetical protein
MDTTTRTAPAYESAIGRAIALLRSGQRISPALAAELREQGYDLPSLHTAHLNQKA